MRTMIHGLIATGLSFGLSLTFWAVFGVFQPGPFWAVSITVAIVGFLAGRLSSRYSVTAIATILVRCAAFAMAMLAS